jgi:hypothetical protein
MDMKEEAEAKVEVRRNNAESFAIERQDSYMAWS